MAIAATNLDDGGANGTISSQDTNSVSPTSNNLILLTVVSRTGISANPNQPTATGNSLTWVAVNSVVFDTTSSSRRRVTVLRAMGSSPSSGAITIDFGGQNQTDVHWSVDQFSGVDTSGTNGSGAIVQSATNWDETDPTTSLTVTLGAFGSTDNATFGGFGVDVNTGIAVGSGFTILGYNQLFAASNAVLTEWKSTNDTSVDITFTGNSFAGGIAIEIKAAAVTTSIKDLIGIGMIAFPR